MNKLFPAAACLAILCFWPIESQENPQGKASFLLGIIPWLSPDAKHPGWPLSLRSLNRRKSASCGHCSFRLISPPMKYPPQAVIGGSSLYQGFQPWTQAAEANRRSKQTGFPLQQRNQNAISAIPLSGTAAKGRQTGCKASCENTENAGEKGHTSLDDPSKLV